MLLTGQRNEQQRQVLGYLASRLRPKSADAIQKALGPRFSEINTVFSLDDVLAKLNAEEMARETTGKAVSKSVEDASNSASSALGQAFTTFGGIRAVAKAASMAFNGSKDFVNTLGAWHIARYEDKNVLAEFKFYV